jgi:hypothetical protein
MHTYTNIHAPSGTGTHDRRDRTIEGVSYLRPRGYCDRRVDAVRAIKLGRIRSIRHAENMRRRNMYTILVERSKENKLVDIGIDKYGNIEINPTIIRSENEIEPPPFKMWASVGSD